MSRVPGIGDVRLRQLKAYFGALGRAWAASSEELRRSGLDSRVVDQLCEARRTLSPEAEVMALRRHGIRALTSDDAAYPSLLAEAADCPPVLYVRGELPEKDRLTLAMVGTRRPSAYGRQVASELVEGLVAAGVVTVSGLARGIDTAIHRETLDHHGVTVAVLAGGLDAVYPGENLSLAQRILDRGAIVSEHPPHTRLRREHFLRRNRIMSGISRGTIVVEAGERSGALATARNALDQNREVFAVPGSIFSPQSTGTNRLIQRGEAKLVLSAADVVTEFGLTPEPLQRGDPVTLQADALQAGILGHLGATPVHADDLARLLVAPSQEVSAALSMLELQGVVRNLGNMHYVITGRWLPEVS